MVLSLVSTSASAKEIAILCKGTSTTFAAPEVGTPSVETSILPDQTYILDDEKKLVWRWLAPLNQREQQCNDASCISAYTNTSIDLLWHPKSDVLQWEWSLELDRVTGHAVSYNQMRRGTYLRHHRQDMMCSPTALPVPTKPVRAF
jgi:hypothetical protein